MRFFSVESSTSSSKSCAAIGSIQITGALLQNRQLWKLRARREMCGTEREELRPGSDVESGRGPQCAWHGVPFRVQTIWRQPRLPEAVAKVSRQGGPRPRLGRLGELEVSVSRQLDHNERSPTSFKGAGVSGRLSNEPTDGWFHTNNLFCLLFIVFL